VHLGKRSPRPYRLRPVPPPPRPPCAARGARWELPSPPRSRSAPAGAQQTTTPMRLRAGPSRPATGARSRPPACDDGDKAAGAPLLGCCRPPPGEPRPKAVSRCGRRGRPGARRGPGAVSSAVAEAQRLGSRASGRGSVGCWCAGRAAGLSQPFWAEIGALGVFFPLRFLQRVPGGAGAAQ